MRFTAGCRGIDTDGLESGIGVSGGITSGNPLNPRLKPWDKRECAKKATPESLQEPT